MGNLPSIAVWLSSNALVVSNKVVLCQSIVFVLARIDTLTKFKVADFQQKRICTSFLRQTKTHFPV